MSQAVANLLINAAQYTPPGGHIGLAAHLETDAVTISVKDTGVGFQPTAIPAMFDMFTVVAPAGSRSEGGLSIGLSFVKGLIALHDGTVEAKSAGAGGGSRVRDPPTARDHRRSRTHPRSVPAVAAPAVTRCKVLIIDDNRDSADTVSLIL